MPECNMLKNHMCFTVNGNWRPCCRFNENILPFEKKFRVKDYTFDQWRESDFYKGIIEAQETGWHEGCKGCEVAEATGNQSTRLQFDKLLSGEPNQINYIEMSLSDECNLACKMCGPWASSTWNKIAKENEELLQGYIKPMKFPFTADVDKVFNDIDFEHVNTIKILGGEPFIVPETKRFLELLEKANVLGQLTFMTNTNATFFPKKLTSLLNQFKQLSISLSLDGVGSTNDYIRYKSNWDNVVEIIQQWKEFYSTRHDKSSLKFASVISAYNAHQLDEIYDFADTYGIELKWNIINGPEMLKLDALPINYIDDLKEQYANNKRTIPLYNYLDSIEFNPSNHDKLKIYTQKMDSITGMKLVDYNPKLAKHLGVN